MIIGNHYWVIADSTTEVYSSASNTMVAPDDADYVAWMANNVASNILNVAELAAVLQARGSQLPAWLFTAQSFIQPTSETYSTDQLKAYCADARYRKEQGGLTLVSGMPIRTDDRAQAKINGAMLAAKYPPVPTKAPPGGGGPAFTTKWHAADGTFWPLGTTDIVAMSGALQLHIDQCFEASSGTMDAIDAGTVTTLDQIDQAFAW